ncbi:MAG: universal stress protein [Deltaproteobacteria bacterium]|nr:MAG: universal stress protein [Deltaproteobacteria bacterium]
MTGGRHVIPEIKKILYATDLSKNAHHALSYAASLANRYGAGLTILHVLEDTSAYQDSLVINILGQDRWEQLRAENEEKVITMMKDRVKNFCDDVSKEMPACPFITDDVVVKIGHPVEEILKTAESINADLLVLGARGHGVIADALLGSVSRRVLRRCKRPVLVIPYS